MKIRLSGQQAPKWLENISPAAQEALLVLLRGMLAELFAEQQARQERNRDGSSDE